MSRGEAPSSPSKGVVCLEGGKTLSEQGGRGDVAEMDGQGAPGLPCKCLSISTGMALKEAHESLMRVPLCHKQLRGVRQLVPKGRGAENTELPSWGGSAGPHRSSLVAEAR